MHNNNNNHQFKIEERSKGVASMLAQSMTETEIAEQLEGGTNRLHADMGFFEKVQELRQDTQLKGLLNN